MKHIIIVAYTLLSFNPLIAQQKKAPAAPAKSATPAKPGMPVNEKPLKNLMDSFSYAIGMNVAHSMADQGITDVDLDIVRQAMNDVYQGKQTKLTKEDANMKLQEQLMAFKMKKLEGEKAKGKEFLDKNAKKTGVTVLPNGLQYEVIVAGEPNGQKPAAVDTVVVNYVGTLIDGTEFDNSLKRGQPATFPLNGVIRGWTEILQLMPKGAHWRVAIPSDLGYGDRGAGASIPPGATLLFDIILLDIKKAASK